MAISKIIYKSSASAAGETWMDVTQKTVDAGNMLSGTTALKKDGTDVTGNIASMTLPSAASSTSSGTSKATITPTTSAQYLNIPAGYNDAAQFYTIGVISGGDYDIVGGTVTPAANSKTIFVDVDFEPTHAIIYADYTNWAYTSWQEWGNVIDTSFSYYLSIQARINNGSFQYNSANRAISNVSYSNGKFKFADTTFNFQAGTTYTWYVWREKT